MATKGFRVFFGVRDKSDRAWQALYMVFLGSELVTNAYRIVGIGWLISYYSWEHDMSSIDSFFTSLWTQIFTSTFLQDDNRYEK